MPIATFHRIVAEAGGLRIEKVELPFEDTAYDTVCEALSDAEDPLHHSMWRAILQHVENEIHA